MGKRQAIPVSRLTREKGEESELRTLLLVVVRREFRFIRFAIKCEMRPHRLRARFASTSSWFTKISQTQTPQAMSMDSDLYDFLAISGMPIAFEEGNAEVPFLHLGKDETEIH